MATFIEAKANLAQMLEDQAAGRYRVIGYEPVTQGVETFSNLNRYVRVRFVQGDFSKAYNSDGDDFIQDDHLEVILTVSKSASIDLSALDDPNATNAERESAIVASLTSDEEVDTAMDLFYQLIQSIIMKPENRFFQGEENSIADRWIESFKKDGLIAKGEYSVLHGKMVLTLKTIEEVTGEDQVLLTEIDGDISITLDESEEDTYTETKFKEEYTE